MNKRMFRLVHQQARENAAHLCREAPDGYVVTVAEPNRNLSQNAAQWPILEAFAEQLQWPVNGMMQRITSDDWKDILTCAFKNQQPRVAQGLDGGMVLLGQRTSQFSKRDFSDWLEFLHATAIERGVRLEVDHGAMQDL